MTKAITLAKVVSTGNILADGVVNATEVTGLHAVATSGSYDDLINKPTLTTTSISEGSNLYFTNARARSAISVTGSGSYDSSTGVITISGGVTSVNSQTGAVTLNTTNISEGSNLYFTDARARSAISVSGSGSYDSATGVITVTGGVTSVNTRTGAVSILSSDITGALGYTPLIGGAGGAMVLTNNTITANYNLEAGKNAFTVGPVTIQSGVTITIPANQRWIVA